MSIFSKIFNKPAVEKVDSNKPQPKVKPQPKNAQKSQPMPKAAVTPKRVVQPQVINTTPVTTPQASQVSKNKINPTDDMLNMNNNYKRYVFLYACNDWWGTMKDYYNKNFHNIEILGTQQPSALVSAFQQSTIAQYLFIYISDKDEVPYVNNLINGIANSLDIISVSIFRSADLSEAVTRHYKANYKIPVYKIPQKITAAILKSMMATVVKNQPPIEIKELQKTKTIPTVHYAIDDIKHDIFKLDLDRLIAQINSLKEGVYANTNDLNLLKLSIYNATKDTLSDFKTQFSSLSHIKYCQTIEEECNRVLETRFSNDIVTSNFSTLVANKVAIYILKTDAMKEILDEIIRTSQAAINSRDAEINSYSTALQKLKTKTGDKDIIQQERNNLIAKLKEIFTSTKFYLQLIQNSCIIHNNIQSESKQLFTKYILDKRLSNLMPYLQKKCLVIDKDIAAKNDLLVENTTVMSNALARINQSLLNSDSLIEIKDLIIVDPMKYFVTDRSNIDSVKSIQTNLQNVTQLIYAQPGSNFSVLLNQIIDDNTCILYFGYEGSGFINNTHLNSEHIFNCEEFLAMKPRNIGSIIVDFTDSKNYSEDVLEGIYSQLAYISNLYSSVIIYINSQVIFKKEYTPLELKLISYARYASIISRDDQNIEKRLNDLVKVLSVITPMMNTKERCIIFFNKTEPSRIMELSDFKNNLDTNSIPVVCCAIPFIKTLQNQSPAVTQRTRESLYNTILRR